ncbi:MAG TPA: ABC transporter substrate-binding protein [Ramlibacter sp.]|uniref:ABC transporter substrate-binding protein n=1 Tax=Ramlibacter sp. TaxID=1917967 RepID=UPI002D8016A1|nr:ABC transporter substrate-binding protein [Ramlibacter sp.]HET8746386.1 ABC transporter substrate-binding protein [Ramlibacter sp.]
MALAGCSLLRVAPHARLEVMDPTWTTAYITRNHGYLVYDTLFAYDENFEARPQMVDTWTVSPDRKAWTFTLREQLKWHDGTPVTAADCVASLQRWGKRDGAGQLLFKQVESIAASDERTFHIQLRSPRTDLPQLFAKMSGMVPFMLPKQQAQLDPSVPITSPIGSGPYKYSRFWSVPFMNKVAYVKNRHYVGRQEPLSLAAGNKEGEADRIEWIYYPTAAEAARALIDAQVDYVESPSYREVPLLKKAKRITVATTDPLGNIGMARFNMQQPPFDNVAVRRAALMAMQQEDYMQAALGDPSYWRTCYSVFPCGTPLAAPTDALKAAGLEQARAALAAAKYDGSPVVLLNPVDSPVLSAFTAVTAEKLSRIGMNVVVEDMDWATLLKRRTNRGPVGQGGWSMFHTWWLAGDLLDPSAIAFSGDPANGWTGWLRDDALESARVAFATAGTPTERKAIAAQVQQRIVADAPFAVLGQFFEPVAFAKKVQGITSPIQFYWQLHK